MGFLDRLFGKKPAVIEEPGALRDRLMALANAGDEAGLLAVCKANQGRIAELFPSWTNLKAYPNFNPQDRDRLQYIINGLGNIAEIFRDHLGDASLWKRIAGEPDNAMVQFDRVLAEAQKLAEVMRYEEVVELLTGKLIDTSQLVGSGADKFRAYAHGSLGAAMLQGNRAADAPAHFEQALALCTVMNDRAGIHVHLSNLYETYRYLGDGAKAAGYADRLAELCAGTGEEKRWRRKAAQVRAGEPLLRMAVHTQQGVMELDEIGKLQGEVRFVFERNRMTLLRAQALVRKGGEAVAAGRLEEALGFCREATRADAFDPDAHFKAGEVLLLLQRYAEAIEEYEKTAELAPGWFHVGSDLWVAQELVAGRLEQEDLHMLLLLEDGGMDPQQKLQAAEVLIGRRPRLAQAHFHRAVALQELRRENDAREAIRAGLGCAPEPDIHSRLLAQLAALSGREEQEKLYREILGIEGGNMMSRTMATVMLKQVKG